MCKRLCRNPILTLLFIFIKLTCVPDSLQENKMLTSHLMKMLIILLIFFLTSKQNVCPLFCFVMSYCDYDYSGYGKLKDISRLPQARKRLPISLSSHMTAFLCLPAAAEHIRPEMPFASSHSRGLQLPQLQVNPTHLFTQGICRRCLF